MKKIGRNEPCLCGSGIKYKKCCIDKPLVSAADGTLSIMDDRTQRAKENLEKGYQYFYQGDENDALQFWQLLWDDYVKEELNDTDIEAIDDKIGSSELISNWFLEYPVALQNMALKDADLGKQLLEYSDVMLEKAKGSLPDLQESLGLARAVALSRLGRDQEADAEFRRLHEEFPAYCSTYVEWSFHLRDNSKEQAQEVLELGLKHCSGFLDQGVLKENLEFLKEYPEQSI